MKYFAIWWQKTLAGLNQGNIQMFNTLTDKHPFEYLKTRLEEIEKYNTNRHIVLIWWTEVSDHKASKLEGMFQ